MCFKGIHIEIVRYFLKNKGFWVGVYKTFSSHFVVQLFCGPLLPHGVTNVNCILFSRVESFNHMLIH